MSPVNSAWLLLAASVAAETQGNISLKFSAGLTRFPSSALAIVGYSAAIWLMSQAVVEIEIGLAYAVWAGASACLTAAIGMWWFAESTSALKIVGLTLAISSIFVLKMSEFRSNGVQGNTPSSHRMGQPSVVADERRDGMQRTSAARPYKGR